MSKDFPYKILNDLLVSSLSDPSLTKDLHSALIQHKNDFRFDSTLDHSQSTSLLAHLLSITNQRADQLLKIAQTQKAKFWDSSKTEVAIYLHFMERERLLNTLEILLNYYDLQAKLVDPITTINYFVQEILKESIVNNLVKLMLSHKERIKKLTPLKNDSTTQLRDQLAKEGASELELNTLVGRLDREQMLISLVLQKFVRKLGLTHSELVDIINRVQSNEELDLLKIVMIAFFTEGTRLKIDSNSFKSLKDLIVASSWKESNYHGSVFLCFCAFLQRYPMHTVDSHTQVILNEDLLIFRKQFIDKFFSDSKLFSFWNQMTAEMNQLEKTSVTLENVDIVRDLNRLSRHLLESALKSFVVDFKKSFRSILARDQDLSSTEEEGKHTLTSWEGLLIFMNGLYLDREDAALEWWTEPELSQFVRLASDVWTPRFLSLFVTVISTLSFGVNCSYHAHSILNMEHSSGLGNVSWSTFFKTLNVYVEKLMSTETQYELSPLESELIVSFLKLLTNVVKFSSTARRLLCENQNYRALDVLFYLLVGKLSIELKAGLMSAIAAFCVSPNDGFDISSHVWQFVEQAQIIPMNLNLYQDNPSIFKSGIQQTSPKGILYDMREIEALVQTYPETIAFLKLMKNLIQSTIESGRAALFETLGAPNRVGGIRIYIHFIIEEIFLKIDERSFINEQEKWTMTLLCLEIFQLSLSCFEMTQALGYLAEQPLEFQANAANQSQVIDIQNPIYVIGLQPGFQVMCSLLEGLRFASKLFDIAAPQSSPKSFAEVTESIYVVLKIIHYSLQVHTAFLEILAPGMVQMNLANRLHLPPSMCGIDAQMANRNEIVLQLAVNINHPVENICLISLLILSSLSKSAAFAMTSFESDMNTCNRLVGIIESSDKSNQILQGFIDRLEADGVEVNTGVDPLEQSINSLLDPCKTIHSTSHSIKLTILDILLWNIQLKDAFNFAHFLLGVKPTRSNEPELEKQLSCFHVIVNMLMDESGISPLYLNQPIFAEKCYRLVYMMTADPGTSEQSLRYLRNVHDYFVGQLSMFGAVHDESIGDVPENVLVARLYQCAWLLNTVALELHMTALSGHRSQSQRLLRLLFSAISLKGIYSDDEARMEFLQKESQTITKIIEILHRLNFTEILTPPIDLSQSIFAELNLAEFMTRDERGTELFDIRTLYLTLNAYVNFMEKNGTIFQSGGRQAAEESRNTLLTLILQKNSNQRIYSGRFACAQAWLMLVRITTKEYMDLLSTDVREKRILELLSNLLQHVNQSTTSTSIGTSASQTVLALISRLKFDKETNQMTNSFNSIQSGSYNSYVLGGILDGIQAPDTSAVLRGNYYSALNTFISYIKPHNIYRGNFMSSRPDEVFVHTASGIFKQPNKFWDILCRDAIDTELVWQAVAFATLGSLCQIINWCYKFGIQQRNNPILGFLIKRNYLGHFIRTIIETDDKILQKITSNAPDVARGEENVRYVFETKMAFFNSLSISVTGAESLIEYGIFETFTECNFLGHLPSFESQGDSMLADEIYEKYFGVTNPVFELIVSIIYRFDSGKNTLVVQKLTAFLNRHNGLIVALIRKGYEKLTLFSLYQLKLITAMFGWLGAKSALVHQTFSGPGQSSFYLCLRDFLEYLLGKKWLPAMTPMNDIEEAKNCTMVTGGKRSMFTEEAIRLSEETVRNMLLFFQSFQPKDISIDHKKMIGYQSLATMVVESTENLSQLVIENQNLRIKTSEISQVSIDEINDICQRYNAPLFNELSVSQRQQLYLKTANESIAYLEERIMILFNIIEMSAVIMLEAHRGTQKDNRVFESIEKALSMNLKENYSIDQSLLQLTWTVLQQPMKYAK